MARTTTKEALAYAQAHFTYSVGSVYDERNRLLQLKRCNGCDYYNFRSVRVKATRVVWVLTHVAPPPARIRFVDGDRYNLHPLNLCDSAYKARQRLQEKAMATTLEPPILTDAEYVPKPTDNPEGLVYTPYAPMMVPNRNTNPHFPQLKTTPKAPPKADEFADALHTTEPGEAKKAYTAKELFRTPQQGTDKLRRFAKAYGANTDLRTFESQARKAEAMMPALTAEAMKVESIIPAPDAEARKAEAIYASHAIRRRTLGEQLKATAKALKEQRPDTAGFDILTIRAELLLEKERNASLVQELELLEISATGITTDLRKSLAEEKARNQDAILSAVTAVHKQVEDYAGDLERLSDVYDTIAEPQQDMRAHVRVHFVGVVILALSVLLSLAVTVATILFATQ